MDEFVQNNLKIPGLPSNSIYLVQPARFSEFPPFYTPESYGTSTVFRNFGELGDNHQNTAKIQAYENKALTQRKYKRMHRIATSS